MRSVDVVAVPSSYFAEIFRDFNLPSQVVSNIADLAAFRYRVRDPIRPRFISTRHFEPIYNVPCTLRAFARVQARYPDATLVLAGGGSEERQLRHLARQLALRGVTFTGPVTQRMISALYDAADVYVQTPVIDNMPGSLVEAFASGLPVVATRVGGVPVILKHGVHGLLAPSDDDEAVARQMMYVLEHPDVARRMATAARSSSNAYDAAVVREKWRAVYFAVASANAARVRRNHAEQP
jgi:glycosyltransferase involved in cell wall biosynthesis